MWTCVTFFEALYPNTEKLESCTSSLRGIARAALRCRPVFQTQRAIEQELRQDLATSSQYWKAEVEFPAFDRAHEGSEEAAFASKEFLRISLLARGSRIR